jgi:hypothetical protein
MVPQRDDHSVSTARTSSIMGIIGDLNISSEQRTTSSNTKPWQPRHGEQLSSGPLADVPPERNPDGSDRLGEFLVNDPVDTLAGSIPNGLDFEAAPLGRRREEPTNAMRLPASGFHDLGKTRPVGRRIRSESSHPCFPLASRRR